jgi:peptidoglycan/LPS O-acetylase OafA/YrhL
MRRFAWFDCLRCLAIFLVMATHSRNIANALPPYLDACFNFLNKIGWVGVDLFFVLSGFLVSGLLFDEHDATGTLNIKRFLIRRAFKIIPAFYVLVLITAIYDAITIHRVVVVHVIHDVLFLQSYRAGAWAHAWTLAIEVHFYILLALLLYGLSRMPAKGGQWLARLPGIICWVLVASFLARLINSELRTGNFNVHREFQPTHLHLDVLAAGVLLRYLYTYHREYLVIFQRGKLFWIGLGLLLVYPSVYLWPPHPAYVTALIPTFNYLGFGLILFEATQIAFPASGVMAWLVKPFDYLGKHSYSIYLWHLPVKQWLVDPLMPGPAGILYFLFFFTASLAVGTFFSEILEMPILHLRNRLFPSKARPIIPPDPGTLTEAA